MKAFFAKHDSIVLQTDYSGIGGVEMSLAMVRQALLDMGLWSEVSPSVTVHRCSDTNEHCRSVLLSHHGKMAPQHVFGDLVERVSRETWSALKLQLEDSKRWFDIDKRNTAALKGAHREAGRAFITEAWEWLKDKGEMQQALPCYRCRKDCAFALTTEEKKHSLVVAAGGNICVAWSSRGTGAGWLHESALIYLVWMLSMWKDCPLGHLLVAHGRRNNSMAQA